MKKVSLIIITLLIYTSAVSQIADLPSSRSVPSNESDVVDSLSSNVTQQEEYKAIFELYDLLISYYRASGDYGNSIQMQNDALQLYEEFYGSISIQLAALYTNLGEDYVHVQEYDKSVQNIQKGIDIYEQYYSQESELLFKEPIYVRGLWLLGLGYGILGDHDNAIKYSRLADNMFLHQNDIQYKKLMCFNLYYLMEEYYKTGQYENLNKVCKRLERIITDFYSKENKEYFRYLLCSAHSYKELGNKPKALEFASQIVLLPKYYVSGKYCIASVYTHFKDFQQAIPLFEECISLSKSPNYDVDLEYIVGSYNALAYIYSNIDVKKAEEFSHLILNNYLDKIEHKDLITTFTNLGQIEYQKDNYTESLEYFTKSYEIAIGTDNYYYIAKCLNEIARCNYQLGNFAEAIYNLNIAKSIVETKIGVESTIYHQITQQLSIYYSHINAFGEGYKINQEIVRYYKNTYGENSEEYAIAIFNVSLFENDDRYAISLLEESLDILENLSYYNPAQFANLYRSLAVRYIKIGNITEGELAFKKCYQILDNSKLLTTINGIYYYVDYGSSHIKHSIKTALNNYRKAYDISEKNNLVAHPFVLNSILCYGILSYAQKGPSYEYLSMILHNTKKIYHTNYEFYSEEERHDVMSVLSQMKNMFINAHKKRNNSLLYDFLLFSKGLLLNTSIEFKKIIENSNDEDLKSNFKEYYNVKKQLYNEISCQSTYNKNHIDSLLKIANNLERELIYKSTEFKSYTDCINVTWQDISSALQKNEVAIEFVDYIDYKSNRKTYAALILRKDWKQPEFIKIADDDFLNKIISCGEELKYDVRINNIYSEPTGYYAIWEPLERYLSAGDNVYFSASGLLHNLSIEYLIDENEVYACDKYNIRRVSSTRDLAVRKGPASCVYRNATLFGGIQYNLDIDTMTLESEKYTINTTRSVELESTDTLRSDLVYLRGSEVEVTSISSILMNKSVNCNVLKGKEANEESFKHLEQKQNDIIHIATHGFYLPTEKVASNEFLKMIPVFVSGTDGQIQFSPVKTSMLRSGLVFAGGNMAWKGERVSAAIEDGIATSAEIANVNLAGTDLVVLSACETGLGEVNDEGVFGLQRAFKKAGVNTIIMSLWKVSDHITQLMMTSFYTHLLEGDSKHDAFRKAQMEIRQEYPNPYQWAAFIMLD